MNLLINGLAAMLSPLPTGPTGFQLDEPVLAAMMSRHDPDNSGTLTLDEYIRMCLFLQSCVRTFTAFDPQRTGQIRLDFNQWVYAASHVA